MNDKPASFRGGLLAALPIVMGYFPIAFSFGVAATRGGLSQPEAVMLSLVIYAGASQFLALTLFASGAPILVAAFTLIAMNVRHVLYGPALMKEAGRDGARRYAWAWAWGLTDEVFGQALGAVARGQRFSESYMFGLGLAAYAAWVLGTAVGAYAGGGALDGWPAVSAGLDFMLSALFLALLLSIFSRLALPAILAAVVATVIGTLFWSGTAGILAGMICGAVAGMAAGLLRGRG
ncbi:branched-chain amino acid ABC transporter permease [Xinfangfangia sp. D13-10-4-6]|uniref:AzlC family ABC transporter permease n=1 Tax=Pseudogemmobacter hezensis TaxID=2737662 RepID=UPI001552254B|nr:AzlC family ABC transporter permease [Pseudogemmobacter hezensis]NPD14603.1 branched-chain amino acid ABC transporter permease [Pseudogemmobacter hezensis]